MSPNQFTLFNQNKRKLSYTISAQEKQKTKQIHSFWELLSKSQAILKRILPTVQNFSF